MKKILILLGLLMIVGSLFAQNFEGEEPKERELKIRSVKKNVVRLHEENLFVFQQEAGGSSWAAGSWDYSLSGLGLSYSRLFNDKIGITVVFGTLFAGIEDPFSENSFGKGVDLTSGSYPFDIDRSGFFGKLGAYFRFGRFGLTPAFVSAVVFKGDPRNDIAWTETDQMSGIGCGFEFFVTDSFLIYLEGAILSGYRFDANILWRAFVNSSKEDENLFTELYKTENFNLVACSLTLGVGLAF